MNLFYKPVTLLDAKQEMENAPEGTEFKTDIYNLVRLANQYELPIGENNAAEISALANVRQELKQGKLKEKKDVQAAFFSFRNRCTDEMELNAIQKEINDMQAKLRRLQAMESQNEKRH